MRNVIKYLLAISVTLALGFSHVYGQENVRKFSLDAGGGGSMLFGDIESDLSYNAQLGVKYSTSRYFGIKANFTTGMLEGSDDFRSFENTYFQYSLRGVFNISQLGNINYYFPDFNIHAYAGVGNVISDAEFVNDNNPDLNNTYSESVLTAPVGVSIKYFLSEKFDLFIDANYAHSKNDLLDAYEPKRTANRANDGFATYTVGVSYKFGSKQDTHYDWDIPEDSDREFKKFKEKQKQKIDEIQTKIENLQSQIEKNKKNHADQEELKSLKDELAVLENKMKDKLSDLQDNYKEVKNQVGSTPDASSSDKSKTKEKASAPSRPDRDYDRLSNKRFVNVIGSFKRLDQAKSFAKDIKQEGYNPGVLYDFPNRFYYVHVTKSRNLKEARETLKQTRKDLGIKDAWIYFRSADDLEKLR